MRSAQNTVDWVAFNRVFAEDLRSAGIIGRRFSSLQEARQVSAFALISLGVDAGRAQAFTSKKNLEDAAKDFERCRQNGYTVFTLEDENYPECLRETFDPPFVLYCLGQVEVLKEPSVSIVGARKPTTYGRAVADKLARDLAACGLVIVSGMARGVDSIAHWGALKEGRTVAVLGSGLENVYPRENRKLADRIAEAGVVMTEFPLNSPPIGFHFPQRNRVISGMSLATIVVEAARRSGSLITAQLALEQSREVMAVPGNITSDLSAGTNWLLKTGAKAVSGWEDVAEEFPSPLREKLLSRKKKKKETAPEMDTREKKVFDFLSVEKEKHIDDILEGCGFSVSEALSLLLNLEIKDLIIQMPGKYFMRKL